MEHVENHFSRNADHRTLTYFFSNLKTIRKINRLRQKEIADILDINRPAYSAYEAGRAMPKLTVLRRLKEHFGYTYEQLLDGIITEETPRNGTL